VRDFQPFCAEGPIRKIKRERGESRARTEGERDKRSVSPAKKREEKTQKGREVRGMGTGDINGIN
jgi:hypothetical protein